MSALVLDIVLSYLSDCPVCEFQQDSEVLIIFLWGDVGMHTRYLPYDNHITRLGTPLSIGQLDALYRPTTFTATNSRQSSVCTLVSHSRVARHSSHAVEAYVAYLSSNRYSRGRTLFFEDWRSRRQSHILSRQGTLAYKCTPHFSFLFRVWCQKLIFHSCL